MILILFLFIRCGTKIGHDVDAKVVLSIIVITLLTIVFCYVRVLRTIRIVKEENSSIVNLYNESMLLTNIEKRTFKKVLTYILVFIMQYIPIMIYNICAFLKVNYIFDITIIVLLYFNTMIFNW